MIANRLTTVSADKSIGEIQKLLLGFRASKMMIDYQDGAPSSIAFQIDRNGYQISFRLPSNWQAMLEALKRDKVPQRYRTKEHAQRVAWRVLRDWMRAQLTLIEAGVAKVEEVMLPWAITGDGQTVAQRMLTSQGLIGLPAPKGGDA
jgi:hypothetical protein